MGVLACPYRGEEIPGLQVRKAETYVCNHPEVRGPCALSKTAEPFASCIACRFWKDSPEVAAEKVTSLPPLDVRAWATLKSIPKRRETPGQTVVPEELACAHRGQYTGETVQCAKPGCKSKIKVYQCELYQLCTISPGEGVEACCATCGEREATSPLAAPAAPTA